MQIKDLAKVLAGICLVLPASGAWPQLRPDDPDWKEFDQPPPPAYSTGHLIPVDMPSHMALRFGVDPATLMLTKDGVVRYVMVASSPDGAVNALYEGLRCATGQYKTYARASGPGPWRVNANAAWATLDLGAVARPAMALAQQGVCDGRAVTGNSVQAIVRALKGQR